MNLKDKMFQKLFAFTILTSAFAIVVNIQRLFSPIAIIAIIIEFFFFAWLYKSIQEEIVKGVIEVRKWKPPK